ncbi:YuzF family protein [Solibacillus sp. FSL H8-0538]|uniref:YuzF family protein n=1 Tax=Solibacillus sp. FSL H8-0538 TaxID=2921400 RepID=UPI0030F50A2A
MQAGNVSNPYLFETIKGLIGQSIVVQTGNNITQGILTAVLPDHIVVEICRTPFFIRMDEIVWITLARTKN